MHQGQEIGSLEVESHLTTADLLQIVRAKMAKKFHPIVALAAPMGSEVLNYALTLPNYPLNNLKSGELELVLGEPVSRRLEVGDLRLLMCLGQGGSASVFLVRHKGTGGLFALKQVEKSYFSDFKKMEQVLREKKIMVEQVREFGFTTHLQATFES
ncbi:unnamed protein product [Sphagnum balticum]